MNWPVLPLKRLVDPARPVTYGIVQAGPDTPGGIPYIRPADMTAGFGVTDRSKLLRTTPEIASSYRRSTVTTGDLVVSIGPSFGKVMIVPGELDGANLTQGTARVAAAEGTNAQFLYWALQSTVTRQFWASNVSGATFRALNLEPLSRTPVTHAPLKEQLRIADFLNVEIARIDQLATTRNSQASALDERELAVIGDMLSGKATRDNGKPTGWRWLPYVPASWKIGPVYAYYRTELGKMLNADRASGDRQRSYLRNANVHWYKITTADMATMHFDPSETQRYSVRAGDLLVCEGGAGVAEAAVWDGRIEDCYFQKSLHRVRKDGPLPVEWLMFWLRLAKSCGVFEADGNISTIPHLTGEQLREYRIPIPDDAQDRVEKINRALAVMGSARARLKQAQGLLAERRQALITAAVTGEFDVSTASGRNVTDGVHA